MTDALDPTAAALARAVDGQFRIEREIGRGGMGVVYLATDLQLEREVALKTLPPHLAADAAVRGRFVREARTAAALSHPNIVPIYHAAERDDVVYFAMGYVPGDSLADRIARAPMSGDDLVPILVELADALGYAHGRGVVHRDVKAENVLLDARTGRAMVTDFGIARVTEAQPLTATGTVLGTVHYMSPEQVMGEPLDGRSDLYALGVLAFYAITGRFPFERPNAPAVLVAHINSAAPRMHEYNPDAPDRLDAIVARLLEKSPEQRFATADALRAALRGESELPRRDLAAPGRAPVQAPPALSSDDARQVWARAAELQAHTGVLTPPPAFAMRADGAAPTTAYDVALIRESAAEAGIDTRYVDRALAERAGAAGASVPTIVPGDTMRRKPNVLLGSHTRLEFETSVDGELDADGFEEVADAVRRTLGEMVNISSVGRTLTVTTTVLGAGKRSATPRQLQVNITSRGGVTRIHAMENLQQTAGATFGIGMGAMGGGLGGMAVGGVMSATQDPALAMGTWALWVVASFFGARKFLARTVEQREAELRTLMERVAEVTREHAVKKLPRP